MAKKIKYYNALIKIVCDDPEDTDSMSDNVYDSIQNLFSACSEGGDVSLYLVKWNKARKPKTTKKKSRK